MERRTFRQVAWLVLGLACVLALPASAGPRSETLDRLRAIEADAGSERVRVRVETGGAPGAAIRIGDALAYVFESDEPGYLTVLHVDMQGATTLLYPRVDVGEGRVQSGGPIRVPGAGDAFELAAQPPVGRDVIYSIVTREPLTRRDLGLSSGGLVVSLEPHQAPPFVERLQEALARRARGSVFVAHATQEIEGREDVQYRSADIVEFFGTRTRSIRPPKLDLQIHFASDSAALDATARRNVDEFAGALEDPKLDRTRFKIAGHTDDTGGAAHNLRLSRRRAEAVRRYLVEVRGIDADRLDIEAHGENDLLMNEQTDYARRMNRRVEFSPAR